MKPEEKRVWGPVSLHLQIGDIIISKKGILSQSIMSDRFQCVYKTKYLGKNRWEILDSKREYVDDCKEVK